MVATSTPIAAGKTRPLHSPSYRPRLEAREDHCLLSAGALDPTFGNVAGFPLGSVSMLCHHLERWCLIFPCESPSCPKEPCTSPRRSTSKRNSH